MDSGARRGDKTKKKTGHKRPRHNYSEDTREFILDQVGVGPERKKRKKASVYTFCQSGHTPHPSTIYRWRQQQLQPHTSDGPHPPRGRPPHLSSVEKLVLGGWVIEQDEHHLPVSINAIQSWVAENFQEKVSAAWVTRAMSSLHITSHRSSTKPDKYRRPHLMKDLFKFLLSLRKKVDEGYEESQVVAVDTVRFTHPSPILRSYSPQGGGQPSLWGHEWDYHTILYEGLVMDGTVLPALIFTDCPSVPKGIEDEFGGKVIYLKEVKAPSANMTLRWFDAVQDYLMDSPLVVTDRGPEFMATRVREEMRGNGIEMLEIPATGGAFVNPCDNPFNSQLRHAYFQERKITYEEKLKAILKAYYSPTESTLASYFEHVGWKGKRPTQNKVHLLLSEGYRPGRKHSLLYKQMETAYRGWKKNLREASLGPRCSFMHRNPEHTWYVWKEE